MAIRFRIDGRLAGRLAFAVSELAETLLSLNVLLNPRRHPLRHPWVRAARRLKPVLRNEIAELAFVYGRVVPAFMLPDGAVAHATLEGELARFLAHDDETLARELTRPLLLPDEAAGAVERERVLSLARLEWNAEPTVKELLADPRAFADRVAALLVAYWEAGFGREWDEIAGDLTGEVTDRAAGLAAQGLDALDGLSPRIRVERGRVVVDLRVSAELDLAAGERLVLSPSVFVWPDLRAAHNARSSYVVLYTPASVAAAAAGPPPDGDLLKALRAVADGTRLRALELLAERPRPTQELAPLIGITEPGLSKHLRQLREAGIVAARREGPYVIYSLVPERLAALGRDLAALARRAHSGSGD